MMLPQKLQSPGALARKSDKLGHSLGATPTQRRSHLLG